MSKTEKFVPNTTVGGRIRNLRNKKNLSQLKFHDLVRPYSKASSEASKKRVIRKWELEGTGLNHDDIKDICKILNCSSDYLLGLDECTNKTNQFIHEQTGLSDEAIENLLSFSERKELVSSLDFLLRSKEFQDILATLYSLASYNYDYVIMFINALGMIDNFMTNPIPLAPTDNLGPNTVISKDNAEFRLNRIFGNIMDNISNVAMEKAVEDLDLSAAKDAILDTIKKSTRRPSDIPT